MSEARRAMLQSVSRRAFGQAHRLELMLTILAASEPVCLSGLAQSMRVSVSSVQVPFADIVSLGLIQPVRNDGTRRRLYAQVDGPGWAWAEVLAAEHAQDG